MTEYFVQNNFNVLLYDYRGFGKSQNFNIEIDILIYPEFLTDLNTAIDFVIFNARRGVLHLAPKIPKSNVKNNQNIHHYCYGYTYINLSCASGIASFDVTTSQGGHIASFLSYLF